MQMKTKPFESSLSLLAYKLTLGGISVSIFYLFLTFLVVLGFELNPFCFSLFFR
jgi:hypothetical protein